MVVETLPTLTIAEAARQAAMHPNSLRYWIERGHVEAVTTPLGRVIVRESLEEFLRNRTQREIEIPAGL